MKVGIFRVMWEDVVDMKSLEVNKKGVKMADRRKWWRRCWPGHTGSP